MRKSLLVRWLLFLPFLFLLSCEKDPADSKPVPPPVPQPAGTRTIRVVVAPEYDLRNAKAYSIVDSLALDQAENTLTIPRGEETVLFLQDRSSQEIVAVVRVDTTQQEVVVNAASVAKGLQDLLPAYASLTAQQQAQFAQVALALPAYQEFMVTVADLLKRQQPIYSTEPAFVKNIRILNSHLLHTYWGDSLATAGSRRPAARDTKDDLAMTDWIKSNESPAITSQVHSYLKATFVPIGAGTSTSLMLEPQSLMRTMWVTTPVTDLKDGYYTLKLNQSEEAVKLKNRHQLAIQLIGAVFGHILDMDKRLSAGNDCFIVMAGNVATGLSSVLADTKASPQEILLKAFPIVGKGIVKGLTTDNCLLFSLEKIVAAEAAVYKKKVALAVLKKLNVWASIIDAGLTIYEFGEAVPFALAYRSPLDLEEIMQIYQGHQRPAYLQVEKDGTLKTSYKPGEKIFPAIKLVPKSYYAAWTKSGFNIKWSLQPGHGQVNLAETRSTSTGSGTVEWTLPKEMGTYSLTAEIKDQEGDHLTGSPLTFQAIVKDAPLTVTSSRSGKIVTATATGGTPPYQYSFYSGGSEATFGSGNTATLLYNGAYAIGVKDATGATAHSSTDIVRDVTITAVTFAKYDKTDGGRGLVTITYTSPLDLLPEFLLPSQVSSTGWNAFCIVTASTHPRFPEWGSKYCSDPSASGADPLIAGSGPFTSGSTKKLYFVIAGAGIANVELGFRLYNTSGGQQAFCPGSTGLSIYGPEYRGTW